MLSGFSENENEPLSSSDFDFASIVVEDISKDFWKNPSISDSSREIALNTMYETYYLPSGYGVYVPIEHVNPTLAIYSDKFITMAKEKKYDARSMQLVAESGMDLTFEPRSIITEANPGEAIECSTRSQRYLRMYGEKKYNLLLFRLLG